MANTKSALKRIRQSERRRLHNAFVGSRAKTFVKKANRLLAEGRVKEAAEAAQQAIIALDKAAEKGVIHKNNAARRKSRLVAKINRAQAAAAAAQQESAPAA